jgi:hypothetical protein
VKAAIQRFCRRVLRRLGYGIDSYYILKNLDLFGTIVSESGIFFYFVGTIISEGGIFFLLCWNNCSSLFKEIILRSKNCSTKKLFKWDLVLKISLQETQWCSGILIWIHVWKI